LRIGGKASLTRGLIVFQFALSVILGISAVILTRQAAFLVSRDLGYVSEGLAVILTQENDPLKFERIFQRFRNEVVSGSYIKGITASNREFGLFLPGSAMEIGGRKVGYRFNRVDPDFVTTMKFKLVKGRDFSPNIGADEDAIIVNERLARELGPHFQVGDYLGDRSKGFPYDRRIIGVIGDSHYASLRFEIEPLVLYVGATSFPRRNAWSRIIVRLDKERAGESVSLLEAAWKRVRPEKPFVYYYQKDALENLYGREKRWGAIVRYASILSLLLA
jgi:putative ABC transport system permease protein